MQLDSNFRKRVLFGITGKLHRWIKSFLVDRSQTVMVNGFLSNPVHVKSGVPQGSVLGPLLFLILISDIDKEILHSFLSSFADDTRVGKPVNFSYNRPIQKIDWGILLLVLKMSLVSPRFHYLKFKKH